MDHFLDINNNDEPNGPEAREDSTSYVSPVTNTRGAFKLESTPQRSESVLEFKNLSESIPVEVYAAKKIKKNSGEIEEVEVPEMNKEDNNNPIHKIKRVIAKKRKTKPVKPLITSNI
ncbi:35338_t:CDS:2 [Gigaspora margarita]|uniref:35338_t:CDS:1 n=1 Tax=Gigaspora margarita TaxID=4874 RepID=A0ABM8W2I7_GIGMA|nr:35338_t:CDS:2 [Gigaspora margarita]